MAAEELVIRLGIQEYRSALIINDFQIFLFDRRSILSEINIKVLL